MRTDDLICMMAKSPPCRCSKRNARIWIGVAALFAVFAAVIAATIGLRGDLAAMASQPSMLFKYAAIAAAATGTGLGWWYSGHPGRSWRISFYGLFALAGLVLATALYTVAGQGAAAMPHVFNGNAYYCAGFVVFFTFTGAAVLARITPCMAPVDCRAHAIMTALFAGSLGALAFSLHCRQDHPAYLALWYGGALLIATMLATPILMKKQAW